ncbi:hypothetical protein EMPS_02988 [Entomortierella parvispora]|uniref:Periplasmic binding protein n=1 Tax=Entomortierella parvispora TaxID=205924 RepID=A0A9P3H5X4_9FUNG|nr:hypothetical protein EMPS_02988 [Entomortierella parvispora]
MSRSVSIALGLALLAVTASAQNDTYCGGSLQPNMYNTFDFTYNHGGNFTVVTMIGPTSNETSLLYCGDAPIGTQALLEAGVNTNVQQFKVPVTSVATSGNFTSSYVELIGQGNSIMYMDDPQLVVSPCLQQRYANKTLQALNDTQYQTQFNNISAAFLMTTQPAENKAVYVPESLEVDPLQRVEYIKAISLFYDLGAEGQSVYNKIRNNYGTLQNAVASIPADQQKRIGWVEYDFSVSAWRIRNSVFTRAIIKDAGGISFPLRGDGVADRSILDITDLQTMIRNSWVVIDQTNFNGQNANQGDFNLWRTLAGVTMDELPGKRVYSLSGTSNAQGVSDYDYRAPARPDLLLQDLIHAQYPSFNVSWTFLDPGFIYGSGPDHVMTAAMCGQAVYNDAPITVYAGGTFSGDGTVSPPLVGSGIYGAASGGSSGSKSKTPIIVAVVVVAAVIGAGFAFAFFKWGKRAKEDRFIELEEEMNNEIPLH